MAGAPFPSPAVSPPAGLRHRSGLSGGEAVIGDQTFSREVLPQRRGDRPTYRAVPILPEVLRGGSSSGRS